MSLKRKDLRHQYYATIVVNFLTLMNSASFAWANVNYVVLQSDPTLLPTGVLHTSEATVMVSISWATALIGNVSFPWIISKFGTQRSLLYLAIPQIVRDHVD